MQHDLSYYFNFWGIPSITVIISFFIIGKPLIRRLIWLCILASLIIYNVSYWNDLQNFVLGQPSGRMGMSENIGYGVNSFEWTNYLV
ncbi:hypothetical protein BH09BAC5_BH09BAC5_06650 [soil metagenome]